MLTIFAGLVLMLAVVVGALITVNITGTLIRLRRGRLGAPREPMACSGVDDPPAVTVRAGHR